MLRPKLKLNDTILEFKSQTKFLGVIFTANLSWKNHIEYIIAKSRKKLNLMKMVVCQSWAQDTNTLINIALSIVQSQLIYGQELYHSAPKSLLKKLQSIDSRALKLALGLPIHTSIMKCYKEIGILSLDEQRKFAAAKYVLRSLNVNYSVKEDIFIDSEVHFPKRSKNIAYLEPIYTYTKSVLKEVKEDIHNITPMPLYPKYPPWEHHIANFDDKYCTVGKNENSNLLSIQAKEHLANVYSNHLQIFTDGSVSENGDCGSAYIIPALKVERSFHIGKDKSIFTCELLAILFALEYKLYVTPTSLL